MIPQNKKALKEASPYTGVITREQFLFYEMRTTARLVEEGLTAAEIAYARKIFSSTPRKSRYVKWRLPVSGA